MNCLTDRTVPLLDYSAYSISDLLSKEPRLSAVRLFGRVTPKKGLQGSSLVPADQQLRVWILSKPTDVGYNTREGEIEQMEKQMQDTTGRTVCAISVDLTSTKHNSCHTQRQKHGNGDLQIVPVGHVITSPYSTLLLRQNISSTQISRTKTGECSQYYILKDSPNLCEPAKKERERTKGLSEPPERLIKPSTVAMCCKET